MESEHGSGINKSSQSPPEFTLCEDDLLGLGKTSSSVMESGHGGGSSKHSQAPAELTVIEDDLFGFGKTPSSVMESGHGDVSDKHPQAPTEVTLFEDDLLGLGKKSEPSSPSSSSSSSDSSFDENFFLMDESEPRKSSVEDPHLAVRDNDTSHELVSSNPASPRPTFPPDVPVLSPESSSPSKSPKQSPRIQVMERPEGHDPSRIPSTVFARTKSTAPVEWSVQSNESLFSIHMGNNSFSRDQIFLMGRSQELGKSEDMFKFPNNTSGEVNNFSIPAGGVPNSDKKTPGIGVAEAAAETMKEVIRETAEDRNKAKPSAEAMHRSTSISHRSEGSGASTMSFAFPILTKDGTKNGSTKVEPEKQKQEQQQQQSQPQPPGANPTVTNWFSCLSCSFCR